MTTGTCREYYQNNVDSFILVSSDSDYWGLISAMPEVRFFVMVESEKCSPTIKNALINAGISYCYIDDFCTGNSNDIKVAAVLREVRQKLDQAFHLNVRDILDEACRATRADMTTAEKNQFYDKYIKTMHVDISPERGSNDRAWKIVPYIGTRGFDPLVLFLLLLNQQFNDNCYRDRYHRINEKRQGVNTMNLKEAFRFQNKLQSMMTDAQSILGNNGNITKVQNTYLRHKVMAEAEDEVTMEAPSTEYSENITEMAEFLLFLLDEREKLSAAIHKAKVSLPLGAGLDGEVSLNREAPGDRHSAPSHGRPAQWRGFDL